MHSEDLHKLIVSMFFLPARKRRSITVMAVLGLVFFLLTACSGLTKSKENISLVSPVAKNSAADLSTLFSQDSKLGATTDTSVEHEPSVKSPSLATPVVHALVINPFKVSTFKRTAEQCRGKNCPTISVSTVVFVGRPAINNFIDRALASLGEDDSNARTPHRSLADYEKWFMQNAKAGSSVTLSASVLRDAKEIVLIKLESYVFLGGANGLSTTQYVNWLPLVDKILSFESMILPGREQAFEDLLRKQHARWLKDNEGAIENPSSFMKTWPFVASDNVGLLSTGLVVTYDPVMIAPRVFGQPSFHISYEALNGILRPELIPKPAVKQPGSDAANLESKSLPASTGASSPPSPIPRLTPKSPSLKPQ